MISFCVYRVHIIVQKRGVVIVNKQDNDEIMKAYKMTISFSHVIIDMDGLVT